MQKIEPNSHEAQSANIVADNIAKLRAMFPELLTETGGIAAINVDVLKALVGDATAYDGDEKYGLNWHGKRKARQIALTPSTGTLRPCPEESVDWETVFVNIVVRFFKRFSVFFPSLVSLAPVQG